MADALKVCSADLLTSLPRSWGLRATLEEGSRLLLDSLVSKVRGSENRTGLRFWSHPEGIPAPTPLGSQPALTAAP